ncbi:MAG: glutamate racemase [Endomicrobiia bacterium]|nr:glutamate racemase [Endomicrobiia bacterium]
MNNRPLGIFDSGVGGLTVVREIMRRLPGESIVYFGDTARVPYGTKSAETIRRYSAQIADFLVAKKVKAIVVACNTASALALSSLRSKYDLPIIGVIEPACRRAAEVSSRNKIGVIGTEATVNSRAYPSAIKKISPRAIVAARACPLLVPLVEDGRLLGDITEAVLAEYLEDILKKRIDTLILGCTHYPLLTSAIKKVVGKKVTVVDSASAVVDALKKTLEERRLLSSPRASRRCRVFYVSDSPERFAKMGKRFLRAHFNGAVKKIDLMEERDV